LRRWADRPIERCPAGELDPEMHREMGRQACCCVIVLLGAVAASLFGGVRPAASQPSQSPSDFARNVVTLLTANRYADAWQLLVAVEKRTVPIGLYVACEERAPIPGHLVSVRVVSIRRAGIAVPGLDRRRPGYAVTVETTIAGIAQSAVTTQFVFQLVSDAGRLGWTLHPDRFHAYRQGHCLQAVPPA